MPDRESRPGLLGILRRSFPARRIPLPPKRLLSRIGRSGYEEVGREFFRIFTESAGLKAGDRVLDIGCGVGRMAVPLTRFLQPSAQYEGFDIDPELVAWCQRQISPRYPGFRFRYIDVKSRRYNPGGSGAGAQLSFPYPAASFDFVLAISVFTHVPPAVLERYVAEIERVLAPQGTLVATFFLMNDEARRMTAEGMARLPFRPSDGVCSYLKPDAPEDAVAYDETFVRHLLAERGLSVVEPVRAGSWCGRTQFLSYQDVLIVRRRAA